MIKHFPIPDFLFEHEIIKSPNGWNINFIIDDIQYQINLNEMVSLKVLNFEELGYDNHYPKLGNVKHALKIVYNIGYFIWLYLNETGKNEISYGFNSDTGLVRTEMFNRAFKRYFDNPTITEKDNRFVITFKEE